MFSLISNSPLSEVLAPQLSPLEEFIVQWNSITDFYSQSSSEKQELNKCRIETTKLPTKLFKIADILVTEQVNHLKSKKDASMCPSMEYLLQNKILDTLSVLAQADTPLGIYPHILMFFIRLLNDSKTELIPHKCVYTSINKLIVICGKTPASPYESTEMYFLGSITDHIYKNSALLNFFLKDSFPLINSLLSLLYSPDSEITKRAGDSLIKLISVLNENADSIVAEKTPFCSKIVNQIISYYNEIPRSLNPLEVENAIYSFRNDSCSQSSFTNSVRKFLCFLKWYIFFDMLIHHSKKDSLLMNTLLTQFKQDFLEASLLPDLTGDGFVDEFDAIDNVFLTTVLITNCLRNTESMILFNSICDFLLIPNSNHKFISNKQQKTDLFSILLKRCNVSDVLKQEVSQFHKDNSIKLSSATLQLFEDILSRPSFNIINELIIKHVETKKYLEINDSTENNERINQLEEDFNFPTVLVEMANVASEVRNFTNICSMPNIDQTHLNQILYFFTSLMPKELKFNFENQNNDYETYINEAIKGFHIFITSCSINWADNPSTREKPSDPQFIESPFLATIFDNLNSMLILPYEINLQIFSIIAKISLIPNELINEYLLDPTVPFKTECRSLFGILHKLVEDLQISVKGIPDLQKKLCLTKKMLLGEEIDLKLGDETNTNVLQSLIILDEFCKELSAVIFAKNNIIRMCKEMLQK